MKIIALLAAAAAATLAVPASAAPAQDHQRVVTRTHTTVSHDRGRHARKAYWRKSCTTKWRNHHRVRVCRKVRAWR